MKMKLNPWIGWVIVIIIILYIVSVVIPQLLSSRRSDWEPRAKNTLRAYGDIQEVYKEANSQGTYASWDELKENGYINKDYLRGNIIENYSLWTFTEQDEFIAVAFPRKTTPPGYLATFAIREDQVLREYSPRPEATEWDENEDCVLTWEPIR